MGLNKAFAGAVGSMLGDQWVDFLTVPSGIPATAALFPAVQQSLNAGRGSNMYGSAHIISNGSRIVVPEGYGLITLENGAITGFAAEPGGYVWNSLDQNSKSMFTGGGFFSSTFVTSWQRFKFGGIPGSQQLAFFVALKELPDNRFGTQSEIFWDDAYLGAQAGAITRGSYTMRIVDPILFVKGFVPAAYISAQPAVFDFTDFNNPAGAQIFSEVVSSLSAAFSRYTNDPSQGNRITRIQSDAIGFAKELSATVETDYQWSSGRGLEIVRVAIDAIEYDADTLRLLSDVRKADALRGERGNAFLQQSVARGIQSAGETGGAAGLVGVGMAGSMIGGLTGGLAQQTAAPGGAAPAGGTSAPAATPAPAAAPAPAETPAAAAAEQGQAAADDPVTRLKQAKELLDAGVITEEDFDSLKKKFLGD